MLIYLTLPILKNTKNRKYIGLINDKLNFCLSKYLKDYMRQMSDKNLLPKRLKGMSPIILLIISIALFFIVNFILNASINIRSTSFILSVPVLFLPLIIIKIILNNEKMKIIRQLPSYVVNLKNHISIDNNITKAIESTVVEAPLKNYIYRFNCNIKNGISVIDAFEELCKFVGVKQFSELVTACEVCYINGGDFIHVLQKYLVMITKENVQREETEEKAYSAILTLGIMLILNVLVISCFLFSNNDYATIIRETFAGRAILNFNVLSYFVIGCLIAKIYKMEE